MVDIKLESGKCTADSLSLGYEDFEFVEGGDCLLQDIRSRLFTDIGALFYDPSYGGRVLRYIHGSRNDLTIQELKQAVKIALKNDDRIVPNSIKVNVSIIDNGISIAMEFTTVDGEQLETEVTI